ncbi:hypothetical protein A9995_02670 [Erythrobacter sp. QSSC1-22B]|uniref:hypothetical protein n=1 Tax=Erythrobacter sp. QSSC1-22B TaxID=1860125 RepID=UPI000805DA21|nr:hypothetical protein [Erythrobacter sp. QSSC1-22B]OBX20621.1 hypothetical protein A9995_02670 [Erythrobacter sp. QSSC1-22B]
MNNDLLYGLKRVAKFLEITPRQAQHLHDTDQIPTFKLGKIVCARKTGLNEHFANIDAQLRNAGDHTG